MNFHVTIICPTTGWEIPTGVVTDIRDFASLPNGKARLDCLGCGKSHWWSHSDVFLAYSLSELEGYAHFASTIDAEGSKIGNLGTARTNEQLVDQHKTIRQIPLDRWEPAVCVNYSF
jgi:hypothetical protein